MKLKNLKTKNINGFSIFYRNEKEFKIIYKENFLDQEYKFYSKKENPFIIDCGSHIGLSILYLKKVYPDSEIIGFEPNPENYQILLKNIKTNKLSNIKVFNLALSNKTGNMNFFINLDQYAPWTWGDTLIPNMWGKNHKTKIIPTKTKLLSTYITRPVNLLKIDIEGSEQAILKEIESKLYLVETIVLEYHPIKSMIKLNDYSVIKQILERHGFIVKAYMKYFMYPLPNLAVDIIKNRLRFTVKATKN